MYIDMIMCMIHRLYYADCRSILLSTGKSLKDVGKIDPIPIDHPNEECDCDENGVKQRTGSKQFVIVIFIAL